MKAHSLRTRCALRRLLLLVVVLLLLLLWLVVLLLLLFLLRKVSEQGAHQVPAQRVPRGGCADQQRAHAAGHLEPVAAARELPRAARVSNAK